MPLAPSESQARERVQSSLVFIKGVPLEFRSDNAPELMSGLVSAMKHYLGVEQITTGGYNPRGNTVVERFMHTLGHMLQIASNEEYNNLKDYLQCIYCVHTQLHIQLSH